jgi:hypothetical protein
MKAQRLKFKAQNKQQDPNTKIQKSSKIQIPFLETGPRTPGGRLAIHELALGA